jgi:ATP-binding cassette, subfamily C (CFTR/MRP), member 1
MDEATASVDSQTDAAVQRIIWEEFADCYRIESESKCHLRIESPEVLSRTMGCRSQPSSENLLIVF